MNVVPRGVPSWQPWHVEPQSRCGAGSPRGGLPRFLSGCPEQSPAPGARVGWFPFRLWHLSGNAEDDIAENHLWAWGGGTCSLGTGVNHRFVPHEPINNHRASHCQQAGLELVAEAQDVLYYLTVPLASAEVGKICWWLEQGQQGCTRAKEDGCHHRHAFSYHDRTHPEEAGRQTHAVLKKDRYQPQPPNYFTAMKWASCPGECVARSPWLWADRGCTVAHRSHQTICQTFPA